MDTGWGRFIRNLRRKEANMMDNKALNEHLLNMKERKNDTEHIEDDDSDISTPSTDRE